MLEDQIEFVDAGFNVPRGEPVVIGLNMFCHTADYWTQQHKGGFPLYTRHMLGVSEAERDRRKRARLGHKTYAPTD